MTITTISSKYKKSIINIYYNYPLLTLAESNVPKNLYYGHDICPLCVPTSVTYSSYPLIPQNAPISSL